MSELTPTLVVLLMGAISTLALVVVWPLTRREQVGVVASFLGHVVSAFAMVWITRALGGGDMFAYHSIARSLTPYLRVDFGLVAPEVLSLLLQRSDPILPVWVFGVGSSTGSMIAVTTFVSYVVADSLYATALVIALLAYFSKLALFRVARENLAPRFHLHILVAILLIPSVVFWSSGIVKEALAISGIALLTLSAQRWFDGRYVVGLLGAFIGAGLVSITKAYFLFVFAVSVGIWLYWRKALRDDWTVELRPAHLLIGGLVAMGGVLLLSQLFPRYAIANVGSEVAQLQASGQVVRGGSTYEFGDPGADTLGGQLLWAPLGLMYALMRPFLFEMTNVPMAVSAVETTALLIALARVLWVRPWTDTWRMLVSSPFLVFCIVFSVGVATAVGISTTNLGTLVRYRMPLLPLYAVTLFVLGARPRQAPVGASETS